MEQMINDFGFPVACVVGCAYFIKNLMDSILVEKKEDRAMYQDTINKFDDKLDKFAIALEGNNSELGAIKEDIKTIKEKVGV